MENSDGDTLAEKLAREPAWTQRPFVQRILRNFPVIILACFLFLLYGFFLAHKIDLTAADLGRHIKNGELIFQNSSVLRTNFYSYTNPDFPVVNHHWGSGVLFYAVWKLFGFLGVQLLFTLLSLAAFLFFLLAAKDRAGWGLAGFVALLAVPLLGERTEIRPEVFSYLFAGLFFFVLSCFSKGCPPRESEDSGCQVSSAEGLDSSAAADGNDRGEGENDRRSVWKFLWLLPLIEILWVNTHIYFLLGPLLVVAFLLESVILHRARFTKLFCVFAAVLAATVVNPFGYRAITEAATLFQNFGYRLAENQSVWFLERLGMANPNFFMFKIFFGILVLSFAMAAYRNWRGVRLSNFFVATGVGTLALLASRNLALFGFFSIPIVAANIQTAFSRRLREPTLRKTAIILAAVTLLFSVIFTLPRYFPYWRSFGFGLEAGNGAAADFIQVNNIRGPIFNNYDIGGYLIFHLFPHEKVFVDNRPEAYPVKFFANEYIPMQENEEKWRKVLSHYGFNAIVFAYHDATPWGQQFLVSRIKDPEWAPVFVDGRVLVLVQRTDENATLIRSFELSRDLFRISR